MDSKKIGQRLRSLRGERTQQMVADELGLTVSAIGMYERGERIPSDENKKEIARYYGVSVEFLFLPNSDTLCDKKGEKNAKTDKQ